MQYIIDGLCPSEYIVYMDYMQIDGQHKKAYETSIKGLLRMLAMNIKLDL